jgi:hypothetical protein
MNCRFAPSCVVFALATSVAGLAVFAQYQVNRQIYGNSGPSMSSVRYAPQYLGGAASAPGSARLLPSEVRNAYVRSGELPSNIKMSYNSIGPLSPTGAIAYIPAPPSYVSRSAPGPQGNLVNPMVSANSGRTSPYAVSAPGSMRYGGALPVANTTHNPFQPIGAPSGSAQSINPTPYSGSPYSGATATPSGNPLNASIRYSR